MKMRMIEKKKRLQRRTRRRSKKNNVRTSYHRKRSATAIEELEGE